MSKSLRSQLYRAARDLGDVQAARQGPLGLAGRVLRRTFMKANSSSPSRSGNRGPAFGHQP
jgi:hypothetical protein